jgi:RimJ/RimL family protein N-acetyltransferase
MANQVAGLINTYSALSKKRFASDIIQGDTNYVVESHGKLVIAICGISRFNQQLSELKHLVVRPEWRGRGVGLFVVKRALELCSTPLVYATVKTSNDPSLSVLKKAGFSEAEKFPGGEGELTFLLRIAPKCTDSARISKSKSPFAPNTT